MRNMTVGNFTVTLAEPGDPIDLNYIGGLIDKIIEGINSYSDRSLSYEKAGYILIEQVMDDMLVSTAKKKDILLYATKDDTKYKNLLIKMQPKLEYIFKIRDINPAYSLAKELVSKAPIIAAMWIWRVMFWFSSRSIGNLDKVCDNVTKWERLPYPYQHRTEMQGSPESIFITSRTKELMVEPCEYIEAALMALHGFLRGEGTSELKSKDSITGEEYERLGVTMLHCKSELDSLQGVLGRITSSAMSDVISSGGVLKIFTQLARDAHLGDTKGVLPSINFEDIRDVVKTFNGNVEYINFIESLGVINSVNVDKGNLSQKYFMEYMKLYIQACVYSLYYAFIRYLLVFGEQSSVTVARAIGKCLMRASFIKCYTKPIIEFINLQYPNEDTKGELLKEAGFKMVTSEVYWSDISNYFDNMLNIIKIIR